MPLMITTWMSALRANLLREQIATQTLLLEYIYWHIPHSVTKGHYFSKNPFKKNLQIEIFYTKMVQDTQKRQASIFDSLF